MNDLAERVAALVHDSLARGVGSATVVHVQHRGRPVVDVAAGQLVRWLADGTQVPASETESTTTDTLFDLASITKVFSTITLLSLVADGVLELDAPIAAHLPTWSSGDRGRVTLRHLLTHTSGLPPMWDGWRGPWAHWRHHQPSAVPRHWPLDDRAELSASLLTVPLACPPLTACAYSCVGYNTAMLLAESATGTWWRQLVRDHALAPLGLGDSVTFQPDTQRCAATEVEPLGHSPGRGVVRGIVHDESSWALGGACANAGLFGDAASVARVGEALRLGALPLPAELCAQMWQNQLPTLLGRDVADPVEASWGQTLGLRIGQRSWMGSTGGSSRGHTGFTGTSLLVDRERQLTVVALTNRVHPSRAGESGHALRAAVADACARWVDAR